MSDDHEKYVKRAIEIAREGMQANLGGPFGAVVVKRGEMLAEAANEVTSRNDPTAHAEILAIRRACELIKHFDLSGATLYASSLPCPMCFGAIAWARLEAVYYAGAYEDAKMAGFDDRVIADEFKKAPNERAIPFIAVEGAVKEARTLFSLWNSKEDKRSY